MKILQVAGYGVKLAVKNGGLILRDGDKGEQYVPLSDIDMIIIHTSGVSITSSAIRTLIRAGIEVVFTDYRGDPIGILYTSEPTLTVETKRAQYHAYNTNMGVKLAVEFAASKMHNQALHLRRLHLSLREKILVVAADEITRLEGELLRGIASLDDLEEARVKIMQFEARAAREYWGAIARILPEDLGFHGRSRDYADPVNQTLNYAYGILYSIAWRSLLLAGLDPYAGYLHVDRSGKPVLVFDYVECWRPVIVDSPLIARFLAGWMPDIVDGRLMPESRKEIVAIVKDRLDRHCNGGFRRMTCSEAIRSYALRLAKALREKGVFQCFRGW